MSIVIDLCDDDEGVVAAGKPELKIEPKRENNVVERQAKGITSAANEDHKLEAAIAAGKIEPVMFQDNDDDEDDISPVMLDELNGANPPACGEDAKLSSLQHMVIIEERKVKRLERKLERSKETLSKLKKELEEHKAHLQSKIDQQTNWLSSFPWDEKLSEELHNTFGIDSFRALQHEALNATLLGRDVFAILPTGAGKSLIYQLAAVVEGGLTLVVTPLLSLSMDQRASLRRRSIRAESLDSTTPKDTVKRIYAELLPNKGRVVGSSNPRKGRSREPWIADDMPAAILFVTPEQVVKSKRLMARLEMMHEMGHLTRICIDEAHCASTWGHDFRPEYCKLGILRRQLRGVPILCLTATCGRETTEGVGRILELKNSVVFRGNINRPNLFYEVREKKEDETAVIADIAGYVQGEFANQCGIVYVLSRRDAEVYAASLKAYGVAAGAYHGDLDREMRAQIHESWSDGRLLVVVATIAFGMGIDNAHVRFVIHATMACSIEGYYQESGRAGRDGADAKCIILHRAREFPRLSAFVADKGGGRLRKMYEMYEYACSRGAHAVCRRDVIVRSFGQILDGKVDNGNCCDLCQKRKGIGDEITVMDVTNLAKSAGKWTNEYIKAHPDEKVTLNALAAAWANSGAKGTRMRKGEKLLDRGVDVDTRLEILVELVFQGVLREYHRHSSYSINAYVKRGNKSVAKEVVVTVRKQSVDALLRCGARIVERKFEGEVVAMGDTDVLKEEEDGEQERDGIEGNGIRDDDERNEDVMVWGDTRFKRKHEARPVSMGNTNGVKEEVVMQESEAVEGNEVVEEGIGSDEEVVVRRKRRRVTRRVSDGED